MNTTMNEKAERAGVLWLRLAVIYLLAGVTMGVVMSATHRYEYAPVHAHINLLGWATLALSGLLYRQFPAMAASPLQRWHFWLHNLGLPVLMVALFFYLGGNASLEPVLAIGSLVVVAGLVLLAVNLFRNA